MLRNNAQEDREHIELLVFDQNWLQKLILYHSTPKDAVLPKHLLNWMNGNRYYLKSQQSKEIG